MLTWQDLKEVPLGRARDESKSVLMPIAIRALRQRRRVGDLEDQRAQTVTGGVGSHFEAGESGFQFVDPGGDLWSRSGIQRACAFGQRYAGQEGARE